MQFTPAIRLAVAVVLGLAAVLLGRAWLVGQAAKAPPPAAIVAEPSEMAEQETPAMETILAASRDIESGDLVDAVVFEEIEWPAGLVPDGALRDASDLMLLFDGEAYARGFIAAGEPLVDAKLSGQPPRVVLTAEIEPGFRAVTIAVTDTTGVAGFVLPEDRVDLYAVALQLRGEEAAGPIANGLADPSRVGLVLSNVRVLAVDQTFSKTLEGAKPSRSVTLEVAPKDVPRIAGAMQVAEFALALIGDEELEVGAPEIAEPVVEAKKPVVRAPVRQVRRAPRRPRTADITLIHGNSRSEVETPVAPQPPTKTETAS